MKKRIFIAVYILLLGIFVNNCGNNQEQEHNWKIEEIDGVIVVKNRTEPLFGEFAFDLEEDISIGGNVEEDNYYFPKGVSRPFIDEELNLYVVDRGNSRIQKYSKAGDYLATIGRRGQGPGEFLSPSEWSMDSQGKIWVYDPSARAFKVFTNEGVYKKNIVNKTRLSQVHISKEGYIFGRQDSYTSSGNSRTAVVRFNPETLEMDMVDEFILEKRENKPWFALHYYSDHLYFNRLTNSSFCYGFSSEYKIFVIDGIGNVYRIIEKQEEPISISKEERDLNAKEGVFYVLGRSKPEDWDDLDYPSQRPFFRGILTDDMERIYILRTPSILDRDATKIFDIFGKEGGYLYRMILPFFPAVIQAGFLFEIRTEDETGEVTIVRHTIKNWDHMKEGI